MNQEFDVLVIGCGVAGFSAAMTLAEAGKKVAVISRGSGASSVSSGAWDFGPVSLGSQESFEALAGGWKHRYNAILREGAGLFDVAKAKESIAKIEGSLGMSFRFTRPFCLPTSMGCWKSVYGAQGIQVSATLEGLLNKKVGLVGGRHWRFRPDLVAKKLKAAAKELGHHLNLEPIWIEDDGVGGDCPLPQVATRLENDATLKKSFIDSAVKSCKNFDTLLFPPLFTSEIIKTEFESALSVPVAELLSTIEPVAGYRLYLAIQECFQKKNIPFIESTDVSPIERRGVIDKLHVQRRGRKDKEAIRANQFVLASGKYFGGGVSLGYEELKESIFGLSLFEERGSLPIAFRSELDWEGIDFNLAQPWAKIGVWVDEQWRPMDGTRSPVYENLVACGSVIGGVDYAAEKIGLGFMNFSGSSCVQKFL